MRGFVDPSFTHLLRSTFPCSAQVQEILVRQKQPRGNLETEEARSILALFFFVV
jgi:hypothetical protein